MNEPKYKNKSKYTTFDTLLHILNKLWINKNSPNYEILKERIKNNYYQGNKHHLINSIQKLQPNTPYP